MREGPAADRAPSGLELRERVPLAPLTTLGVGGPARLFVVARDVAGVRSALEEARRRGVPAQLLGLGSNVLFDDAGFEGLVLRPAIPGMEFREEGERVTVRAGAGVEWDSLVAAAVERGLAGVECLSGIPGSVGAAPVQNVGAYGQEISETLRSVEVLDRATLERRTLPAVECGFGYRGSRFKGEDRDRFVILEVRLSLEPEGRPALRYPELERRVKEEGELDALEAPEALRRVRRVVREIRAGKGMLLEPGEDRPGTAGSFFLNPVLDEASLEELRRRSAAAGVGPPPVYPARGGWKVPAAWLVERAGFPKGFRRGDVGISERHALALVSHGGTAAGLRELAEDVRSQVRDRFGVALEIEPAVLGPGGPAPAGRSPGSREGE